MSFDPSALPDYVDQEKDALISAPVLGAKTSKLVEVQAGIKYKSALQLGDTTVTLQADVTCTRNPSGTTTFDKRDIEVFPLKEEEDLCVKDLRKKWLNRKIKPGSKDDQMPFAEWYMKRKMRKIAGANEQLMWRGDTASGVGNLNKFDGFLKQIDTEAVSIDGNTTSATSITEANIIAIIKGMYSSIPSELLPDDNGDTEQLDEVAILMGLDNIRTAMLAYVDKNFFHYTPELESKMEFVMPGTKIRIIGIPGLTGTDRMVAGQLSNFVAGVDLEGEEDDILMEYDKFERKIKYGSYWKLGVKIKIPSQIVEFTKDTP